MSMEFGWWIRDPAQGKYQVWVRFHGGNVEFLKKEARTQPWIPLTPITAEVWDKLMEEAQKRVPRRLMSPKQYAELERARLIAGY
jgi:hypothetical protein